VLVSKTPKEIKTMNAKVKEAMTALETLYKLQLIPKGEYLTLKSNLKGEEAEAIADRILAVYNTFKTMPKTYETEKVKDKIVHLHYFIGSWDWYVFEKDVEEEEQIQAFGFVTSNLCPEGEMGYINLQEVTQAGAEVDLYWTPKPLSECKK
jgi:hypothetical protein